MSFENTCIVCIREFDVVTGRRANNVGGAGYCMEAIRGTIVPRAIYGQPHEEGATPSAGHRVEGRERIIPCHYPLCFMLSRQIRRCLSALPKGPGSPVVPSIITASGTGSPGQAGSSSLSPPGASPTSPGLPLIPQQALLGVSKEYAVLLQERAARGVGMPTVYSNPGAQGQVGRLSVEELSAIPPPRRPYFPRKESEETWRYIRSLSFGFVMVGLAIYMHAKTTLGNASSGARASLEGRAPLLVKALVALGLAVDLSPLEKEGATPLDLGALGERVFAKFTAGGAHQIPWGRAVKLVALARGEGEGEGGVETAAAATPAWVGAALAAASLSPTSPPATLTRAQFSAVFAHATSTLPPSLTYLNTCEKLGVAAAPKGALALLGQLYTRIVEGRPMGGVFTPTALATLAGELGWSMSEEAALTAILDSSAAIKRGLKPPPAAATAATAGGTPAPSKQQPPIAVHLTRDEFVEFMLLAAAQTSAQLPTEESLHDTIRVFSLLHLDGLRQSAGVAPT